MGYLREADKDDVRLLFGWVNESCVRKNSFSTAEITYDEHLKWFEDVLAKPDVKQFIYMDEDGPAGQVRIAINGNQAEISYSVCAEKRCMGVGKEMLVLLAQKIKNEFPQILTLTAKVKTDNIASQKAFQDLGYKQKYYAYEIEVDEAVKCKIPKKIRGGERVLLLTNNRNALSLYYWLHSRCEVCLYSERLELSWIRKLHPEIIVSYNYRYIIPQDIIQYMNGKIINLHISYLPWNRGSSPNFWSFIDNTPKGVTIHQIDKGLDTGKILYQRQCYFNENTESFSSTYQKLNEEIVELFEEKWDEIQSGKYESYEQSGAGSHHTKKDIELLRSRIDFDWDESIAKFLERYRKIKDGDIQGDHT